ncbi:hypothetical protein CANARDRAFT_185902, partial [[Candida] arabinofermentans NRRL YB-2248]
GGEDKNKDLQKIKPLIEKLSSSAVNDRTIAINSITILCDNDSEIRKLFLKNDLIKILINKLLVDSSDEVVVDSFGLLRNLIIEEGYDLSVYLWRENIWSIFENALNKCISSLNHINDSTSSDLQKNLLIDLIDNLISCIGSLSSEVSIELFQDKILINLQNSNFLQFVFELIMKNISKKLTITSFEFLYDLSTISTNFIDLLSNDNTLKELLNTVQPNNNLSNAYLIGLQFQLLEYTNNLSDDLTINILEKLINISKNKIDLSFTINQLNLPLQTEKLSKEDELKLNLAKENFKIIDLLLDLFSTIIEIKGEQYFNKSKSDDRINEFFINELMNKFLNPLIINDFKDNKILICLNNLSIYFKSINQITETFVEFLNNTDKLLIPRFIKTLQNSHHSIPLDSQDLELLNDQLIYVQTSIELNPNLINEFNMDIINKLISLNTSHLLNTNSNLISQYTTSLLNFITIIAKNCNSIELTSTITKFIVDENILNLMNKYESTTITEIHKSYNYLIESILIDSINCIFELFDDDYSYNREIYHTGKLGEFLQTQVLSKFRKIYKNIDKFKQPELKERAEETLTNLDRFIKYKETE